MHGPGILRAGIALAAGFGLAGARALAPAQQRSSAPGVVAAAATPSIAMVIWHTEGGKGMTSFIAYFRVKPDPLAK